MYRNPGMKSSIHGDKQVTVPSLVILRRQPGGLTREGHYNPQGPRNDGRDCEFNALSSRNLNKKTKSSEAKQSRIAGGMFGDI